MKIPRFQQTWAPANSWVAGAAPLVPRQLTTTTKCSPGLVPKIAVQKDPVYKLPDVVRDGLACVFVLPRQLVLAGQTLASISGPAQKLLDGALCIQHNTNLSNLTQSRHPSNPWLYLYKLLHTTDC